MISFSDRLAALRREHEALLSRPNRPLDGNGIFERWEHPVLTAAHTPLEWRYDLDPKTNPCLMERFGIHAVFNSGAIKWGDRYVLVARVEAADRKSFFAVADGWIYGLFCVERKDPAAAPGDLSSAVAACGIARTRDLVEWERLPDLKSDSQQRNVVLHPEFVQGKYALYTRPQDGFIDAGGGGGIGWALVDDITQAEVKEEKIISARHYHTVTECKNGEGPQPVRTAQGWLHLAHGVRGCASGLRYVLYMYMTALDDPSRVIAEPAGFLMAPLGGEYVGDVMNVLFSNGWIVDPDGKVFIYYASSDTRLHVATSTVDRLVDYCLHTAPDGFRTGRTVERLNRLIDKNLNLKETA